MTQGISSVAGLFVFLTASRFVSQTPPALPTDISLKSITEAGSVAVITALLVWHICIYGPRRERAQEEREQRDRAARDAQVQAYLTLIQTIRTEENARRNELISLLRPEHGKPSKGA